MKWDKAVKQIEFGLNNGHDVEIRYHRKWMKQDVHYGHVDSVTGYQWHGELCQVVNTYDDQVDESMHIIDFVKIEF